MTWSGREPSIFTRLFGNTRLDYRTTGSVLSAGAGGRRDRARSRLYTGVAVMTSPKKFSQYADECVRLAKEARDAERRQFLLELAKRFARAAVQGETAIALIDDLPVPKTETSAFKRRQRRPDRRN